MANALERAAEHNRGRGGVVLRISCGDNVLFEGASGYTERVRDVGRNPCGQRMSADTPFEIASITKMFTATMISKLVEAGKLSLDTTLGELELGPLVNGLDAKISVRQLLSHTSGLPDYWDDDAFRRAFKEHPELGWAPAELIAYAKQMDPAGARGRE